MSIFQSDSNKVLTFVRITTMALRPDRTRHRLCRSQEGLILKPGETAAIEPPLVGCFVAAALYPTAIVVTHCGPGMNDLTCRYHRDLRPEPTAPLGLTLLSLDLATTTHWQRRRQEYQSARSELIAMLAVSLQIPPDFIEPNLYAADANIKVALNQSGELKIDGLNYRPAIACR